MQKNIFVDRNYVGQYQSIFSQRISQVVLWEMVKKKQTRVSKIQIILCGFFGRKNKAANV